MLKRSTNARFAEKRLSVLSRGPAAQHLHSNLACCVVVSVACIKLIALVARVGISTGRVSTDAGWHEISTASAFDHRPTISGPRPQVCEMHETKLASAKLAQRR